MLSGHEEMQTEAGAESTSQTSVLVTYQQLLQHLHLRRRFWNLPEIDRGKDHPVQKAAWIYQSSQDLLFLMLRARMVGERNTVSEDTLSGTESLLCHLLALGS